MSTARIHRYIAREIALPTLIGLLVFTFVLLMGRILKLVELVVNKGVPLGEMLQLFAYLLPAFLVITIPLAFLLGVLLGFGRLSADNEIVALKGSGIPLYGMLRPVLVLALLCTLGTAWLTLYGNPSGQSAFRDQVFEIARSRANVGILPRVFNDEFEGLVLYAGDIDERRGEMSGVFISDERIGATPAVILAGRGRVISDPEQRILTLRLENGTIHRRPVDKQGDTYQVIGFTTYDINLNMGQQLDEAGGRQKKLREFPLPELWAKLESAQTPEERRPLRVELHKRFALPLAPLVFALVGVPLGIRTQRSGKGGGFATALAIFMAYYICATFGETLALESGFPPLATLWAPNLLFFLAGLALLRRAARERPLPAQEWLEQRLRSWRQGRTGRQP
jgi:lipopolysaccharide export system permease protein